MGDNLIDLHVTHIQAAGQSDESITARRRLLRALDRDLPLGLIFATTDDLARWLSKPGWSKATRAVYHSHAYQFFLWATAQGLMDRSPMLTLPRPPTPVCLPRPIGEDVIALLLAQREPLPTIVLLGAYAGLRRFEMAALWREHVTEDEITVMHAKGGDREVVPAHPAVWAHVKDRPPGPLIRGRYNGRQLTPDGLGDYWLRARRRLGLPDDLVPHQLRHRFGTEVQRRGGNIRVTQEVLRHASLASTQIYTAVSDRERRAAVELLP